MNGYLVCLELQSIIWYGARSAVVKTVLILMPCAVIECQCQCQTVWFLLGCCARHIASPEAFSSCGSALHSKRQ